MQNNIKHDNVLPGNKSTGFTPMAFLASLGAGGITVSFFAFINYTVEHGKGLMTYTKTQELVNGPILYLYNFFEIGMFLFMLVHFGLSVYFFTKLFKWLKTGAYKEMIQDPLTNTAILAPFISLIMSFNVVIAAVRYFVPAVQANFQAIMLPALIVWGIVWLALMWTEINLLKISFTKGFDINKIHFGWLLHPFALAMASVTGAGIAAMAQNKAVADVAAFMLVISASMGAFLLVVKSVALFKSHFASEGLPAKQFLPSLLIVIPNITLFAITAFRMGHYLEHHYNANLGPYFMIVTTTAFAFELWYMGFGLLMLKDYIKKNLFNEFHLSQWGLVCPFVAIAVLGSFVYTTFSSNLLLFWFIIATIIATSGVYFYLLGKQFICSRRRAKAGAKVESFVCA